MYDFFSGTSEDKEKEFSFQLSFFRFSVYALRFVLKAGFHLSPMAGELHCQCSLMSKLVCISEIIFSFDDYQA